MSLTGLTAAFLIATAVVILTCRALYPIAGRFQQPPVVAEMIAGVVLGPSLLGALFPSVQDAIFPAQLKPVLYVVAQLGLALFMFVVGLEFPVDRLRSRRGPLTVSAAGITGPLLLGALFVALTWDRGSLSLYGDSLTMPTAMIYVGLVLAITAFPMLARIISERGLSGTPLGGLTLASGALDDVVAWMLLALVLSLASDDPSHAVLAGLGGIGLVIGLLLVRPLLRKLLSRGPVGAERHLVVAAVLVLVTCWFTEKTGLYAVFGAFAAGVAFPRGPVAERVSEQIRPPAVVFLLPLFFAYSGLNTKVTLIDTWLLAGLATLLVVFAFAGKLGACTLAARSLGTSWADASRTGWLMNARGLMQLIALNIGLQEKLITPTLFSMGVIVAIFTTLAASPGLALVDRITGTRTAGYGPAGPGGTARPGGTQDAGPTAGASAGVGTMAGARAASGASAGVGKAAAGSTPVEEPREAA